MPSPSSSSQSPSLISWIMKVLDVEASWLVAETTQTVSSKDWSSFTFWRDGACMCKSISLTPPSNSVVVCWYVPEKPVSICQCMGASVDPAITVSLPAGIVIPLNCIVTSLDWPG